MKRAALRALDGLKNTTYLRRWLVLGGLIGVVAGVGAIVFIHALDFATEFLLGGLGGYTPPGPVGEGHAAGSAGFDRPWAIPLVVGLGGLVSGLITVRFAPEAEGHGTDAAIEAFHHNPGGVRPRAVLVKILASAVTIGAGGSAGREGPTAQVSAGFGSLLGRVLRLSPSDARIAVAAGIGSGIGAIFRAPLGGAVLGAEILYGEDVEAEALLPSVVASVVVSIQRGNSLLFPDWDTALEPGDLVSVLTRSASAAEVRRGFSPGPLEEPGDHAREGPDLI